MADGQTHVTLLAYAIAEDLTLREACRRFVAHETPPEVGRVDPARDHTRAHWAARQGIDYRVFIYCRVFTRWPLPEPLPPECIPRKGAGIHSPRWWEDPEGIDVIKIKQAALEESVKALQARVRRVYVMVQTEFLANRARAQRLAARMNHLRFLNRQLRTLVQEALDAVEAGRTVMLHAGDLEALRHKLFPYDKYQEHQRWEGELLAKRRARRLTRRNKKPNGHAAIV